MARIEASLADGFARLYRWSTDGCRGESTQLRTGAGIGDGPQPVWILTAHPLERSTCEDRGCAAEFTEPAWPRGPAGISRT